MPVPLKDRSWFERKVRELADVLRRLPGPRQAAVTDALEADRAPGARQATGGLPDMDAGESGSTDDFGR